MPNCFGRRAVGVGRKYWAIVQKDLLLELRGKDMWVTMAAFVVMVVFLFGFAVDPFRVRLAPVFPGLIWLAFLFAGTLAMGRGFEHEVQQDALTGLLVAPGDRLAIFLAKLTVAFLFLGSVEVVTLPLFFALFNQAVRGSLGTLGLILALGALGFVGTGTLFGAMAANTRAGQVLVPVLMLPFATPVLIMAVEATTGVLGVGRVGSPWAWIHALMAYDTLFLALPLLLYEYVWEV
jgi:heme exporter protein B